MKITVFGATGGTGRHVVEQALDAGHHVTAVVRDPAGLPRSDHPRSDHPRSDHPRSDHPRLDPVIADVMRPAAIEASVTGRDAVISALGPRGRGAGQVCAEGARSIIAALDDPATAGHTISLGY
ncbi:NAD(P)-dependent oxidoreductase [Nonomuraea gerenzanensis]|uniref:Flavin reductase n=1 Tax=Nonomuraea gerenzanensis TaxID=93944 RepID=A0A1M4DXC2_9ACTN|nr:NAD(P)H-binding protein [Nonomuraea gerenzanensis]UBU13561.1 NAD(P)H-binding protein [Nonomuraea gerenzanensis]SBO91226.1 Flavin reductase [Nonomuraea gerenzanensis]